MATPDVSISTQGTPAPLTPASAAGVAAAAASEAATTGAAALVGDSQAQGSMPGAQESGPLAAANASPKAAVAHRYSAPASARGLLMSVAERASARLNSFGPFHGSANCLAEMRAHSPPRSSHSPSPSPSPSPSSSCLSLDASSSSGENGETAAGAAERAARAAADAAAASAERRYEAWKALHPSALQSFDKFIGLVGGRRLAVFLDYDGTLSPIVEDPDKAVMSEGMRAVVREVAGCFPTAIISGRGREKVYNFVQLPELYYAGSHGMDIMMPLSLSSSASTSPGPCASAPAAPSWHQHLPRKANGTAAAPGSRANGTSEGAAGAEASGRSGSGARAEEADCADAAAGPCRAEETLFHDPSLETRSSDANGHDVILFQPAKQFAPVMEKVFAELTERAAVVEGACIENNNFCVTIHFRRVKEELWDQLADVVSDVVDRYPELRTTHGRKVLEIRPQLEWNKGKAVSYLLHTLGLTDCKEVMAVYIGDDRTDEDAFLALKERGNGCGIVVAAAAKSTVASFSLRDPSEVMDFLQKLVSWEREHEAGRLRQGLSNGS